MTAVARNANDLAVRGCNSVGRVSASQAYTPAEKDSRIPGNAERFTLSAVPLDTDFYHVIPRIDRPDTARAADAESEAG